MLFTVTAVGNNDGENTRASACLHLMKGPHDDNLNQSNHCMAIERGIYNATTQSN